MGFSRQEYGVGCHCLLRSFSIFGLKSSFEKLRKWTTNQWSFMSLSSTIVMKFIYTRFPTGHTGASWILSGRTFISSRCFHLRKKICTAYCSACQGEWLFFHKTLENDPYWSGKSKHKLFPNFCIFKHNDNLLIKIYLQPFSLLPHGRMQYKLLLITGWLKDVKANLDCQYSKTAKLSPHLKIEDWDKD